MGDCDNIYYSYNNFYYSILAFNQQSDYRDNYVTLDTLMRPQFYS